MLLGEIFAVALQSIRVNLLRSMLTMLGIIIGVAAVITMVALGTGAQKSIEEQIVITSYSIHYTKLYDRETRKRPASA